MTFSDDVKALKNQNDADWQEVYKKGGDREHISPHHKQQWERLAERYAPTFDAMVAAGGGMNLLHTEVLKDACTAMGVDPQHPDRLLPAVLRVVRKLAALKEAIS